MAKLEVSKKILAKKPLKVKTSAALVEKSKNLPKKSKNINSTTTEESSKNKKQKSTSKKIVKKTKNDKSNHPLIKHKNEIEQLKDIDPEFYEFLKKNDKKLLEFDFDDSEDDMDDKKMEEKLDNESENEEDDDEEELVHKPKGNLEIASDESDFEPSDDDDDNENNKKSSNIVTLKLLKTWQVQLQEKHPSIDTIRKVIQAFSSALAGLTGEVNKMTVYKADTPAAFNGIIQLCVLQLQPAIHKFLNIKSKQPLHKCKNWKKIQSSLRRYFQDLSKLLEHVTSSSILAVLLKHLHQTGHMIASFSSISKPVLKRLITLWSTSEETVRVLSFLCILKITRSQISVLNHVLKTMYLSYVRNSKFVSPNTLPNINFMRRSLVEMFALDINISYQHAFLYIRQLAIHLRNAMILKKKDSFQAVYNWQYINSIRLWAEFLGATSDKHQMQLLVYPLVSITIGVIKLIPTAQYFPLRFHCIESLINLTRVSNVFIPVLPFILEVLNSNTFNKKHTIVSMKPMQFTCILRLNKSQLSENGFRDEVVENICKLILQYLNNESSSLSYPDLVVPTVMFLKKYLKECKNSNHSRKLKQLLDKIIDNSKFIETERQKITFSLKDVKEIEAWETNIRNKGTPLSIYYDNWIKTHETKKRRQIADTDEINDYGNIPFVKRRKLNEKSMQNDDKEIELFPSDDEDELLQLEGNKKEMKVTKNKKIKKHKTALEKINENLIENDNGDNDSTIEEDVDIVKDLDIDDW